MATASVTNTLVTGATILASDHNTNYSDLVTFLNTNVVHTDGSQAMTGALAMGTNKITGLGDPTTAQDAATKTYVDSKTWVEADITDLGSYLTTVAMNDISDVTITTIASGELLSWNGSAFINQTLAELDLLTVTTAAATYLPLAGGTMTGAIAMGTAQITGLGDPTLAQDAATKNYVDTNFAGTSAIATDGDFALSNDAGDVNYGSTGTASARIKTIDGDWVVGTGKVVFSGTGVNGGSAGSDWKLTGLPTPSTAHDYDWAVLGTCILYDSSLGTPVPGLVVYDATDNQIRLAQTHAGSDFYDNGDYFTIAAGDRIGFNFSYEV